MTEQASILELLWRQATRPEGEEEEEEEEETLCNVMVERTRTVEAAVLFFDDFMAFFEGKARHLHRTKKYNHDEYEDDPEWKQLCRRIEGNRFCRFFDERYLVMPRIGCFSTAGAP